jgi:hypothetical protein
MVQKESLQLNRSRWFISPHLTKLSGSIHLGHNKVIQKPHVSIDAEDAWGDCPLFGKKLGHNLNPQ